ncbi:hypothetical protein Hdeb2414_s0002g00052351 [Helianthus debilis subsp. tardiflorus]
MVTEERGALWNLIGFRGGRYTTTSHTLQVRGGGFRAFSSNPSNYTYISLKNNFYINIFSLKTNTFSLSFSIK